MIKNPTQVWREACERAIDDVEGAPSGEMQGDFAIEAACHLLALARQLRGVECVECGGHGIRAYASVGTWKNDSVGPGITSDVCNICWGSGRADRCGPNLRAIHAELKSGR